MEEQQNTSNETSLSVRQMDPRKKAICRAAIGDYQVAMNMLSTGPQDNWLCRAKSILDVHGYDLACFWVCQEACLPLR